MLNKENLEKSAILRRGENREFWEEFDKTLQKQRVEVTFKMDGHFYPETMHSVGSPYLCEFSNKDVNFFEFKPQGVLPTKRGKHTLREFWEEKSRFSLPKESSAFSIIE